MENLINVKNLIDDLDKYIVIDLRSPVEFEKGTIKSAVNMPLLDNESRKVIGTLYKENQQEAYEQGLKIGVQSLPIIYDEVSKLKSQNPNKEIVFFCFRGGTRSKSVHNMLQLMKLSSYKLDGGYKAYRQYILDNITSYLDKINWIVLTGNTGTGKTKILNELLEQGYPVIDLEKLANNRGSIFGKIGLDGNINQRDFDSNLFIQLKKYVDSGITNVFVECESKRIGNINLPANMYEKMQEGSRVLIETSIEKRIDIINNDYSPNDINKDLIKQLVVSNEYFKKVLGKDWVKEMLEYIEKCNYNTFIKRMLLDYYDKLYLKSQIKYKYDMIISTDEDSEIINKLKEYYDKLI